MCNPLYIFEPNLQDRETTLAFGQRLTSHCKDIDECLSWPACDAKHEPATASRWRPHLVGSSCKSLVSSDRTGLSSLVAPHEDFRANGQQRHHKMVIGHRSADDGVVLLFDIAVVVFLVGAAPGEGDMFGLAVAGQCALMNSEPLSESRPSKGNGICARMRYEALKDMDLGLILSRRLFRSMPLATSVRFSEWQ